jgi:hypothetical protein
MRITRATPDDLGALVAFRDEAAAWLAADGIDQWQAPWPTEDLMVEGMLRNIEAGETFIVWDDDHTPAATITVNRWAKPELWTEQERAEPALYAHKATVDRAYGGQAWGPSCWTGPAQGGRRRGRLATRRRVDDQRAPPALLPA